MMISVIYLAVLFIASTHGRVAFTDNALQDISNNVVDDVVKLNETQIIIDLPTIKPETSTVNWNDITNDSKVAKSPNDVDSNIIPKVTADNISTTSSTTVPSLYIDNLNIIDRDSEENEVVPDIGTVLRLSDYIKENRLKEARDASRVTDPMFLGVESYTGFLTVNETYDSNLFVWYFPVAGKPVNETPWIIWMNGGPGASSMTGLFDEIGPFEVVRSDLPLQKNPYSWCRNHSMLFIDNPVGTGFSFTNSKDGFVTDMETYGAHLYSALKQFLQIFPELRTAPLYIAGESYAGKYVPALAFNIHRHKDEENINLQGLITGNAYVDPPMISEMERPFYYFGLMEPEQIAQIKPLIDAFRKDVEDKNSVSAKDRWNHLITILLVMSSQRHAYNFLQDDLLVGRYIEFLKQPQVKKAIHTGGIEFSFVNMTVNEKLNGDFLSSAKWMYEQLLDHYSVLTYCGQLDQMLSCVLTSENYRTWSWNGSKEFLSAVRHPFLFNHRVAGYHKSGGHLTEVVIRGAGHMAPMDAPAPMQDLVTRWTHQQGLGQLTLLTGTFVQDYVRNNSVVGGNSLGNTHNLIHYL